jgi:hypothetical protein
VILLLAACLIRSDVYDDRLAQLQDTDTDTDGPALQCPTPTTTPPRLDAGSLHTCLRGDDGTLSCWGDSESVGTLPTQAFLQFDAGHLATCGVLAEEGSAHGNVLCFGSETEGHTPDFEPYHQVAIAEWQPFSGCALDEDFIPQCWDSFDTKVAQDAMSLPFCQISVGFDGACGLQPTGNVLCWGSGGTAATHVPDHEQTYSFIDMGPTATCGIRTDGLPVCWGLNAPSVQPIPVTTLSLGSLHVCAIEETGAMICWGDNAWGQSTPPELDASLHWVEVAAGAQHTCGLDSSGTVHCFGDDTYGQLQVSQ